MICAEKELSFRELRNPSGMKDMRFAGQKTIRHRKGKCVRACTDHAKPTTLRPRSRSVLSRVFAFICTFTLFIAQNRTVIQRRSCASSGPSLSILLLPALIAPRLDVPTVAFQWTANCDPKPGFNEHSTRLECRHPRRHHPFDRKLDIPPEPEKPQHDPR